MSGVKEVTEVVLLPIAIINRYKNKYYGNDFNETPKMSHDFLYSLIQDLLEKCEKAIFDNFTVNIYKNMMLMFNPKMGKTRFNEMMECMITLKERLDEEGKMIK